MTNVFENRFVQVSGIALTQESQRGTCAWRQLIRSAPVKLLMILPAKHCDAFPVPNTPKATRHAKRSAWLKTVPRRPEPPSDWHACGKLFIQDATGAELCMGHAVGLVEETGVVG
jgi:hypothetical protein